MFYMRIYARWWKIVYELKIDPTPGGIRAHTRRHAIVALPYAHVRARCANVRKGEERESLTIP